MWVHKYIYNTTDHTERKRYCHVNKHLENGSLWKSFVFLLALSSKTSLKIVFTYSCYICCFSDFFSSRHNSSSGVILRSSFNWFVRPFQNKSSDLMFISYGDTFSSLFPVYEVLFKKRAGVYYQVSKLEAKLRVFLNGFKLSDIDQLILPLMDLGLLSSKKLDVKLSRVFIKHEDKTVKHEDTH